MKAVMVVMVILEMVTTVMTQVMVLLALGDGGVW